MSRKRLLSRFGRNNPLYKVSAWYNKSKPAGCWGKSFWLVEVKEEVEGECIGPFLNTHRGNISLDPVTQGISPFPFLQEINGVVVLLMFLCASWGFDSGWSFSRFAHQ